MVFDLIKTMVGYFVTDFRDLKSFAPSAITLIHKGNQVAVVHCSQVTTIDT